MPTEPTINPFLQFVPAILIFVIFYFLLIKPQKDKQREHKRMVEQLKKNDQVVTAGGIHGTVVNVKDTTVMIRVDDNVRMEVDKEAISTVKKNSTP